MDPKSIVCEYYRQGKCTKGFKCKYSHDLNVERKGGKIDLFTDQCAACLPLQMSVEGPKSPWSVCGMSR